MNKVTHVNYGDIYESWKFLRQPVTHVDQNNECYVCWGWFCIPGRPNNLGCRDISYIWNLYLELTHNFKFSLSNSAILTVFYHCGPLGIFYGKFSFPRAVDTVFLSQLLCFHLSNHFNINRNRSETIPIRIIFDLFKVLKAFPGGTIGKEAACQRRRLKEKWARSLGWEDPPGQGNPLQRYDRIYLCMLSCFGCV